MSKFFDLFKQKEPAKPMDLSNFEEAREKLHETVKSTARELDAFGDLVRDMRGLKPIKKRTKAR